MTTAVVRGATGSIRKDYAMALEIALRQGRYAVMVFFSLRSPLHGRWDRRKVREYRVTEELDFPRILRSDLAITTRGGLRVLRYEGQQKLIPTLQELVKCMDARLAALEEQKNARWWELCHVVVFYPTELPLMAGPLVEHYPKDGVMRLTDASFTPFIPQFAPRKSAIERVVTASILAKGHTSVEAVRDVLLDAISKAPDGRPRTALRMYFGIDPEGRNSAQWIAKRIGVSTGMVNVYVKDLLRPLGLTLDEAKFALGLIA